jgi:glyoxylase-like metal-dependent hydrolase (beta-lactamase superfamily II)
MCPLGGGLIDGASGFLREAKLVCHVLLVEGKDGLTLVDTGLGSRDVAHPLWRLGAPFVALTRPKLELAETARAQVERLGFSARDVRDLVVTHLDLDHAGGIGDFPEARVHVHAPELEAALRPRFADRTRYRAAHFSHRPNWVRHSVDGERWKGFGAVRAVGEDVLLVPLVGHTRGHAGVAVRDGDRWLLHAGDAYFHHGELESPPRCPPALQWFQHLNWNLDERMRNQDRLRTLAREQSDVRVFCAHDVHEYESVLG